MENWLLYGIGCIFGIGVLYMITILIWYSQTKDMSELTLSTIAVVVSSILVVLLGTSIIISAWVTRRHYFTWLALFVGLIGCIAIMFGIVIGIWSTVESPTTSDYMISLTIAIVSVFLIGSAVVYYITS